VAGSDWLYGAGLAVIIVLFLNVGFAQVYEKPEYPVTPACAPYIVGSIYDTTKPVAPGCDPDSQQAAYNAYVDELNAYNQKLFYFSVIAGVALIAYGLSVGTTKIGYGVMGGGILTLLWGSVSNWESIDGTMKLVLLGGAIAFLIYAGKKFKH